HVPQPHGPIGAARQSPLAVGRNGDAVHFSGIAPKAALDLVVFRVPQAKRLLGSLELATSGQEPASVGGKGQAVDRLRELARCLDVDLEVVQFGTARDVPNAHAPVLAGGENRAAVRGEADALDRLASAQQAGPPATGHFPKAYRAIFAGRGEHFAVRREGNAVDGLRMFADRRALPLARPCVPAEQAAAAV